ncbi:MAG TPA: hypothetical protein PKA64_22325, partial [Myxococcota bacterium]|nr:hypothetical protein [Myxococcota bacterium]
DCDGLADEGVLPAWLPDADGDGFGDRDAAPTLACGAPGSAVLVGGDCDDADPDVHPDAVEVCNDVDDDCVDGNEPDCGVHLQTAPLHWPDGPTRATLPLHPLTRDWVGLLALPTVIDGVDRCQWSSRVQQQGDEVRFDLLPTGCGAAPDGTSIDATAVLFSRSGDVGWTAQGLVDGGGGRTNTTTLAVPPGAAQRQALALCSWSGWTTDPTDPADRACVASPRWADGEVDVTATSEAACPNPGVAFLARGVALGLSPNLAAEVVPVRCEPGRPGVASHLLASGRDHEVLALPRSVRPEVCGETLSWWTDCVQGPAATECTLSCFGPAGSVEVDLLFVDGNFGG